MKRKFEILKTNPLFCNISFEDFERILGCLGASSAYYDSQQLVMLAGDKISSIGFVLSGRVQIIKEDVDGNSNILTELGVAELFGEVFVCAGFSNSPVTLLATEATEILFIEYSRLITTCGSACHFHARLITNMLSLLAEKNLLLNKKIDILSQRSTRGKLLAFFDAQRKAAQKFTIPYNREELAHYLCVDRSAMSAELGRMRDEGLIKFHKNKFEIC
jgi:CRP-like cAMP-binding protein